MQGRRKISKAPGQKRKTRPHVSKASWKLASLEINCMENYCWFTLWAPQTLKHWVFWGPLYLKALVAICPACSPLDGTFYTLADSESCKGEIYLKFKKGYPCPICTRLLGLWFMVSHALWWVPFSFQLDKDYPWKRSTFEADAAYIPFLWEACL